MRVMVAMSGGVDSSVAAALLLEQGHEVVGCTLRLWGGPSDTGCCAAADVDDARRVAQVLGLDHHVFDLSERFDETVVAPYVAAHERGETPNPCVACNRSIKFGALLERAERLGFDALATGHHARVVRGTRGCELRRGADRAKDQSYVLGVLTQRELARVRLPVGELTKARVRALAAARGLRTAAKPDSQEVCFIPRRGRRGFLAERTALTGGSVVDRASGQVLGSVPAVQLITVGQRRGVVAGGGTGPRVVVDVDVDSRRVTVDHRDAATIVQLALDLATLRWTGPARPVPSPVAVQLSAHGACVGATLCDRGVLTLEHSARPVAPGQLAVLYDDRDRDVVVGSATVARAPSA